MTPEEWEAEFAVRPHETFLKLLAIVQSQMVGLQNRDQRLFEEAQVRAGLEQKVQRFAERLSASSRHATEVFASMGRRMLAAEELLREAVGDHCSEHFEPLETCTTCRALALLADPFKID